VAPRQRTVEVLVDHQQTLTDVVTDRGEVSPVDRYEGDRERLNDPESDRTVR
jgi:hypothetical protein